MSAHVSSTDFLPGVEVGLYPILEHPGGPGVEAAKTEKVPDSGQVVFDVEKAGERYWIAGEDANGEQRIVQAFAKAGDPVDVRAQLAASRPAEDHDPARIVRGARTTAHRARAKRRG